jgi:hypothetical protein
MAYLKFGPALLFLIFLSNAPLPTPAYATCCGCSCTPWMGCTCRGYTDPTTGKFCPRCQSNEPVFQIKVSIVEAEPHITLGNESQETTAQSQVTEQVLQLMKGGTCLGNNPTLRLLRNAQDN